MRICFSHMQEGWKTFRVEARRGNSRFYDVSLVGAVWWKKLLKIETKSLKKKKLRLGLVSCSQGSVSSSVDDWMGVDM